MREIAIIGIGQTKIDEHWDLSIRELAGEAIFRTMEDAGRARVDGIFAGNMISGLVEHQSNLGTLIADWTGQRPGEAVKVEAACASGAAAFRSAMMAVASGEMDSAIAVGVEKMTDQHPNDITLALATAADADYELDQGVSFVGLNAMIMQRYMHTYGWHRRDFGPFAVNSHANALHNPYARLHMPITQDDFEHSHMVADPIGLLDASPIGDGAAAALIVPADSLSPNGLPRITIAGSASATDTLAVHSRKDPLFLQAAWQSARKAYDQAQVSPADIDFFELHDAFTIMAALSLEACGFAERGQGVRLALDGDIQIGGKLPICTRGGLKARGHPVGATGMYQIVEVVQQLRGECGQTQVEGARIGMAQNIGGSGATIVTHILKRQ